MKRISIINKLTNALTVIGFGLLVIVAVSCSDMLESDSSRQAFEPSMDEKTDSVFYAFGIMQAMQQLADQYVFQGEMRGDLISTTGYTDNNLRQLADFSATTTNKYDSAYVYYRVINNCNYYIQHRDTTLMTGGTNVTVEEYAAVKAIRAWAYLQLVRNYGEVPFFTEPLTQISQIDNNNYETVGLSRLVQLLASDLEAYSASPVPLYGNMGLQRSTNFGSRKNMYTPLLAIPVDVILGDLYLEDGQYGKAANHYITYLTQVANTTYSDYTAGFSSRDRGSVYSLVPSDMSMSGLFGDSWSPIFGLGSGNQLNEVVSYIPMAVNRLEGPTTEVPKAFGFDFYRNSTSADDCYIDDIQLVASDAFVAMSDSCDFYYVSNLPSSKTVVNKAKLGDMRYNCILRSDMESDELKSWITKYNGANVYLYRRSTVLLHLAEAFNRLGMPDAAFAILKDGINYQWVTDADYISDETRQAVQTTYPLFSIANRSKFENEENYVGIHSHGAGQVGDYAADENGSHSYQPGLTSYRPENVLGKKMEEIAKTYGVNVGTSKQDSINAMEDVLCDEYALELAFEGTRWPDLMRLARHKNADGLYGSNFGGKWLARKLAYKNPTKNLEDENNWYLPFK